MLNKSTFTYGLLDERLRSLGFTVRTQKGKARIYRHEETGASILLPDVPFEEQITPHHVAVALHALKEHSPVDLDREQTARQCGLSQIEQLLKLWQAREVDLNQRRQAVQHIDSVRDKLRDNHGELPDSTPLIRKDRAR